MMSPKGVILIIDQNDVESMKVAVRFGIYGNIKYKPLQKVRATLSAHKHFYTRMFLDNKRR